VIRPGCCANINSIIEKKTVKKKEEPMEVDQHVKEEVKYGFTQILVTQLVECKDIVASRL
jgi:hypothetical protein